MEKLKHLLLGIAIIPVFALQGCGLTEGNSQSSDYDTEDTEEVYEDNTLELLAPYVGEWYYNLCNDDPNSGMPLGYVGQVRLAIYKNGTYRSVATMSRNGGMTAEEVLFDISGDINFDGEYLYLLHDEGAAGPLIARNGGLHTADGQRLSRKGDLF